MKDELKDLKKRLEEAKSTMDAGRLIDNISFLPNAQQYQEMLAGGLKIIEKIEKIEKKMPYQKKRKNKGRK
ncbi:MAG: hypothetical protein HQK65_17855 [Desulfamplus sp.]|nr:hypothetical protein [Desulfamplus sp.]